MCGERQLFLGWTVRNRGPLENGGDDFRRAFKTGAAVDLQLGTRPAAAADRTAPEAGDIRIVITRLAGKPAAVLYRPVATAAPGPTRSPAASPTSRPAAAKNWSATCRSRPEKRGGHRRMGKRAQAASPAPVSGHGVTGLREAGLDGPTCGTARTCVLGSDPAAVLFVAESHSAR
jgi:hypothetical protein